MDFFSTDYMRGLYRLSTDTRNDLLTGPWQEEGLPTRLLKVCLNDKFIGFGFDMLQGQPALHAFTDPDTLPAPIALDTLTINPLWIHPGLSAVFEAAGNAAKGSTLLYTTPRDHPAPEVEALASLRRVQELFLEKAVPLMQSVWNNADNVADIRVPTVEEFKTLAVSAFLEHGHGIERGWAALVYKDVRWCLGCAGEGRAALVQMFPQATPQITRLWKELDMHLQLFPTMDAVSMVWSMDLDVAPSCPNELGLPDLNV